MNQKTMLKKLIYGQTYFDTIIQQIVDKNFTDKIIVKKWTIKDVLQHLTWYNIEVTEALKNKSLSKSQFWKQSIDERNEIIFDNSVKEDFHLIKAKYDSSYEGLMQQVRKLTDHDLNSEKLLQLYILKNSGSPRKAFEFIIGNSSPHHYLEHVDDLVERFELDY